MIDINNCCTGRVRSLECEQRGWTRDSSTCRNLDSVKRLCAISLSATVSKTIDADGFYNGLALEGNSIDRKFFDTRKQCKESCDNDLACASVEVYPVLSGENQGKFACLKHAREDTAFVTPGPGAQPGIAAGINRNVNSLCEDICTVNPTVDNPLPAWCSNVSLTACAGNIKHPFCQRFCALKGVNCDREIKQYCDSIGIEAAKQDEFCGCFLPTSFYENYYADLKKKAAFSTALTTENKVCSFPSCASSILKPYASKQAIDTCPDVFQCIIVPTVNNNGSITGDISIKSDAACTQVKKTETKGGGDGGGGDGSPAKLSTGAIIGIVVAALVVLALIGTAIYYSTRKPKPATRQVRMVPSPVASTSSVTMLGSVPQTPATAPVATSAYDSWGSDKLSSDLFYARARSKYRR